MTGSLLRDAVVIPGWVSDDAFLAGYGAAQAVPGPLFTFSAHLGTVLQGPAGAAVALVAIFLPGLLLAGVMSADTASEITCPFRTSVTACRMSSAVAERKQKGRAQNDDDTPRTVRRRPGLLQLLPARRRSRPR